MLVINSINSFPYSYNYAVPYQYSNIYNNSVFQGMPVQTSQSSDTFEKKGLSSGAKVGIGLGTLAAFAVACDLVFAKGKHIKSIFKSTEKNIDDIESSIKTKTEPVNNPASSAQPKKKIYTEPVINDKLITPDKAKDLPEYNSFEDALNNFKSSISDSNVDKPKNIQEMLDLLKQHNYGNDDSLLSVVTRTKEVDYKDRTVDILNNKLYNIKLSENPILGGGQNQVDIDMVGDYLIQNLADGRKIVSISVPSGRVDFAGRPIRTQLKILSKNHEFTPLQKDLIEIISQRKGKNINENNVADILSIGTVCHNGMQNNGGGFDIQKDIILSSIDAAKRQLKSDEIDKDFINKALNLASGERLYNFNL